jgi:hypothetical protein
MPRLDQREMQYPGQVQDEESHPHRLHAGEHESRGRDQPEIPVAEDDP